MPEEMEGIKHYLVDELDPKKNFMRDFSRWQKILKEIYAKGKIPLIVSGDRILYQSLLYDIDFTKKMETRSTRKQLEEKLKQKKRQFYTRC